MRGSIMKRSKSKRGPSSWRLKWEVERDQATGKRCYAYKTVRGKRDQAEAELRRIIDSMESGAYVAPAKSTLAEWVETWLTTYTGDLAARTLETYTFLLRQRVVPHLGCKALQKLKAGDLDDLYADLRSGRGPDGESVRPLSARRVLHVHRVIYSCLERASKRGLVVKNVARDADAPKPAERQFAAISEERLNDFLLSLAPGTVSKDERRPRRWRLTAQNRELLYWLCTLAAATGMRLGELLALRWCDIDFSTGLVTVHRSVEDTETHGLRVKLPKSNKLRTISVPLSICAELRRLQRQQKEIWLQLGIRPASEDEALIFPTSVDKPDQLLRPRVVSQRFISARDEFGLKGFRFHDLRHQHVSILLRTLALPEVAARAGHANPAVTARIYAHVLDDAHQRGADAVAAMLAKRLQTA